MTHANCIRVLTVDDHPLVREGFSSIINCQADISRAGMASNGREGAIPSESPDARIIVITTFEGDVDVQQALKMGFMDTC
jgi:DNA-binding NarL/FixJ family response regulator